ncbi:MAG: PIN domain-containing protein [Patescibacteria group bacterium]
MTYLVDTNILLRLFLRDHPVQAQKAEKIIENLLIQNQILFIDPLVISEFLFVSTGGKYNISKKEAVHFLFIFFQNKQVVTVNKSVLLNSLDTFQNKNIDFVDCYLALKAKTHSTKVISFDKDFDKIDKNIRLQP